MEYKVNFAKDSSDMAKLKMYVMPELIELHKRNKQFSEVTYDEFYKGVAYGIDIAIRKFKEVIDD